MLEKSHRFSFRKGVPRKVIATPFFVLRYEVNQDKLHCAVVVGKKIDKRAVVRNRIKRQLVSFIKDAVLLDSRYTIVIYAKKDIRDAPSDVLNSQLKHILILGQIIK